MKVYLDVCCLNRPFDDQSQARVRLEAEAVTLILGIIHDGEWEWISSEAVELEIEQMQHVERKAAIQWLLTTADNTVPVEQAEEERAQQLESFGFRAFDALHLACAESSGADPFLTTDDKLLNLATRFSAQLHVEVANPIRGWEV